MQNSKISRRTMLISSGLALFGARLAAVDPHIQPPAPKNKHPFRISLNTSTISGYRLPVEQQIDYCAETGFDGIELWTKDIETYVQKGGTYQRLADRLRSSGLILENIIGFSPWITGGEGMKQMLKEMDMAADYDDVGALALLHAPAGREEVTLSNGLFKQSRSFYLNHNYIV